MRDDQPGPGRIGAAVEHVDGADRDGGARLALLVVLLDGVPDLPGPEPGGTVEPVAARPEEQPLAVPGAGRGRCGTQARTGSDELRKRVKLMNTMRTDATATRPRTTADARATARRFLEPSSSRLAHRQPPHPHHHRDPPPLRRQNRQRLPRPIRDPTRPRRPGGLAPSTPSTPPRSRRPPTAAGFAVRDRGYHAERSHPGHAPAGVAGTAISGGSRGGGSAVVMDARGILET